MVRDEIKHGELFFIFQNNQTTLSSSEIILVVQKILKQIKDSIYHTTN